jgi:hypothetical protein
VSARPIAPGIVVGAAQGPKPTPTWPCDGPALERGGAKADVLRRNRSAGHAGSSTRFTGSAPEASGDASADGADDGIHRQRQPKEAQRPTGQAPVSGHRNRSISGRVLAKKATKTRKTKGRWEYSAADIAAALATARELWQAHHAAEETRSGGMAGRDRTQPLATPRAGYPMVGEGLRAPILSDAEAAERHLMLVTELARRMGVSVDVATQPLISGTEQAQRETIAALEAIERELFGGAS